MLTSDEQYKEAQRARNHLMSKAVNVIAVFDTDCECSYITKGSDDWKRLCKEEAFRKLRMDMMAYE